MPLRGLWAVVHSADGTPPEFRADGGFGVFLVDVFGMESHNQAVLES